MNNAYHVLIEPPAWTREDMPPPLEMLAEQVVASGRLRIHADDARNFITYSGPGYDLSFSRRDMTDPSLMKATRQAIANTLPGGAGAQGVEDAYQRLLARFKHTGEISYEKEMQVARLLCQATHPAVILLALQEGCELFVSYSHNVADLMAIHFWDSQGLNGGMQSVSGDGKAVYVSCGGDPFIEKDEQKTYVTDGFPAMARMLVIAAQELGHFADIIRNRQGVAVGRHSAWLSPLRAHDGVYHARRGDMNQVRQWRQIARQTGVERLAGYEKQLVFLTEHRRFSPLTLWYWLRAHWLKQGLLAAATRHQLGLLEAFPKKLAHHPYWGTNLQACLADMAFNLAPDADAYRREDPEEEEAIACIEALARVPQQVVKWGHAATRLCWPNLYRIYYEEVIPATIAAYERATGKKFYMPEMKARVKRKPLKVSPRANR